MSGKLARAWAYRQGSGHVTSGTDSRGRGVEVVAFGIGGEACWSASAAGGLVEVASGVEDSLSDAKHAAELWLAGRD